METSLHHQKDLPENRIALLESLVDCLDRERRVLCDPNIQALWEVVEEKHGILQAIENLSPDHDAGAQAGETEAGGESSTLEGGASPDRRTNLLKEQIRERARENAAIVRDSLEFVNELVALITGGPGESGTYSPLGSGNRAQGHRVYQREV